MLKAKFQTFVYSPSTITTSELAIAATRADGVGVINAEFEKSPENIFKCLEAVENQKTGAKAAYGLKLSFVNKEIYKKLEPYFNSNLEWIIVDGNSVDDFLAIEQSAKSRKYKLLVECIDGKTPDCVKKKQVDGVIVKGNESGGYVGEESCFILVQKCSKQTDLPIYVHGGVTPHVAAACSALGVAGGVLDSQVLLLEESPVAEALQKIIAPLAGSETIAVGNGEKGEYFRLLNRPNLKVAKEFIAKAEEQPIDKIRKLVDKNDVNWANPSLGLLPVGHDVCFAQNWRKQYSTVAKVIRAINDAVESYPSKIAANPPLAQNSPLAQDLGIKFPIVQGPMTRVSDTPAFANHIAEGGGLPMLAFALLKGRQITELLQETKQLMGNKPWGIGLLGFVPNFLLQEQIDAALPFKPNYAIIAGGRPDQAVKLESQGIPSFLHLPSANLLDNFLKNGARRFIFEGRECGGHIGPLSSFTLWSTMIDRLLVGLDECGVKGEDVHCLFAGGIHDEYSSAMLQIMVAPLVEKGVKIGIIMGSAYLFTKEIVQGKAIVDEFQKVVIDCEHTVNLETGPGHASRCAYTPFAKTFFKARKDYKTNSDLPVDEIRLKLDEMIMGTLRMASKGVTRKGQGGELISVNTKEQKQGGMYMLGQVVTLRDKVLTIDELHNQVTVGANLLLAESFEQNKENATIKAKASVKTDSGCADIAIVGMSCALPGAKNIQQYWQNILDKVEAVGEIPKERWDWRLYFSEDRHTKDKIYSKWGGFIGDMVLTR